MIESYGESAKVKRYKEINGNLNTHHMRVLKTKINIIRRY